MIKTRDELQKSCDNISSEFNKINEIKQRCEQEMEALKRDNKSLNEKNKSLKNKLVEMENLLKQTHDEKQSLLRNATDIEKKIESERIRDEKIGDLTRLIYEKETEKKELENKLEQIMNEVKSLKDLENAVSSTNRELENLNKDLLAKINDLETTIKRQRNYQEIVSENAVLITQRTELTQKLTRLENELKSAEDKCDDFNEKELEIEKLRDVNQTLSAQVEELNADRTRLEKEKESSRSIIKDMNDDFAAQSAVIESLNEEKASLVAMIEKNEITNIKTISESETSAKSKSSDRHETLINDNNKLQEVNRELLEKLENLEKSSERKILDLSQEIENLTEVSKNPVLIEKSEESLTNSDELYHAKAEKEKLENKLQQIMVEVNETSNKNIFLEQKVENFLILEQKVERLKLSNEKLSRQLDETLVSMHHSEGIQANTEFEYLR
jgi:golgin subfamily A member 4